MIYRFERRARRWQSVAAIGAVWTGLLALWIGLDMAWWIGAVLATFTLPALWDMIRDARAVVEVWPNRIRWRAAFSQGNRSDIDHVRLNRRFLGGYKVLLEHVGGATTRLPPDIAPPAEAFTAALEEAGIAVQTHPFSPF